MAIVWLEVNAIMLNVEASSSRRFIGVSLGILIAITVIFVPRFRQFDQDAECSDNERVEISGTLSLRTYFGPPNFGETPEQDAIERMPVLLLDDPTQFCSETIEEKIASTANINEIQLVIITPHQEFIGKRVVVNGELFRAHTGHHHTRYLIDVESVAIAEPK